MTEPILFNPDNRLLGGGVGDLSLFGGQADPHISIQQVQADVPVKLEASAAASDASIPAQMVAQVDPGIVAASVAPAADVSGNDVIATLSFQITAPDAPFSPASPIEPLQVASPAADFHGTVQGAGSVAPVVEPVAAAPAPAAENVVAGTAASMLDHLAAPADGLHLAHTVDGVLSPVTDLADGILSATTTLLDDTLDGLGGSDPLGGVATLVNMVSTSDVFDLSPVTGAVGDLTGHTTGLVDTLIGDDLLPDSLLGTHDDHGLFGGDHAHEHPLGL